MKKSILYILFSLLLPITLFSCSSEEILPDKQDELNSYTIDISVPSSIRTRGDETRSYGDGTTISYLKYYVYMQSSGNSADPIMKGDIAITDVGGKRGGKLHVMLPIVDKYDFVFIATSQNPEDNASKVKYNLANRTLNVNYDNISTNDDGADCFFGVLKDINADKGFNHDVTLKRPFAQLNIGTKDLSEYNSMSSSSLQSIGVAVNGVYSSMKVMDGSVSGNILKVTFPATNLPSSQVFPVSETTYLSMNYLLVNERKDVTVTLTANNTTSSFSTDYTSIPLQRNHQTNLYGKLLTKSNDFKVEVNPDFGGSNNESLETKPKEYDLILRTTDDCSPSTDPQYLSLVYEDESGASHTVALTPYIDDEKYVKVRWDELGINNAVSLRFNGGVISLGVQRRQFIKSLEKCDISKLHIKSLKNFFYMCWYLEDVEGIKDWDTSQINNMSYMFCGCNSLEQLDLKNFDTHNVSDMSYMFYSCSNLTNLDISGFDTSSNTSMQSMFDGCKNLTYLDVANFDTSNCNNFSLAFRNCVLLTSLDVSNFDTHNATTMNNMFDGCANLTYLDVSKFDTTKCTALYSMFSDCHNINNLDVSHFITKNCTSFSALFNNCYNLTYIDVSNFDTSSALIMGKMFANCNKLTSIDVSHFDTRNTTQMNSMFEGCSNLTSLDVSGFDVENTKMFQSMFEGCSGLSYLDISGFKPKRIEYAQYMFEGCSGLLSLDVSGMNVWTYVYDVTQMFANCTNLETIYYSYLFFPESARQTNVYLNCPATKIKI